MRPKEWLHQNGHIANPNQRGRLSLEHKALIEKAVSEGVLIDGYVKSSTPAKDGAANVARVAKPSQVIMDVPDQVRDESLWTATITVDGKPRPVGLRTVDNGCGNSLTHCRCGNPRVWVDHTREAVVDFKPTNVKE